MGSVCILDGCLDCRHRIRPLGLPVSTNRGQERVPSELYRVVVEV